MPLPNLDELCGKYLSFRTLIQAGETFERLQPDNVPQNPETYAALRQLALEILDPVIEQFGPIRLTYGFAARGLTQHIAGRIAPELDQHASYEKKPNGTYICSRLGAAVDFHVPEHSSRKVSLWIAQQTNFDRLYFYGADRPIHVSAGPEQKKEIIQMMPSEQTGRRIPRRLSLENLMRETE